MSILIGADPEIFVAKNGRPCSAHGLIPGTKTNPHPVPDGAVQVDGMALEFNIDPAKTEADFVHNIQSVMNTLVSMVDGFDPMVSATADFDHLDFNTLPEEAVELGCDSDYNCYARKENPQPEAEGIKFRTAAGHVHIGWTEDVDPLDPEHFDACCMLAQQLDWFLGVPALMFDKDRRRRKLYGKMGSFRPKSYGMEYRVLSNAWLKDPELMAWVFRNAMAAFERLAGGEQIGRREGERVHNFTRFKNITHVCKEYLPHYNIELPPEKFCYDEV